MPMVLSCYKTEHSVYKTEGRLLYHIIIQVKASLLMVSFTPWGSVWKTGYVTDESVNATNLISECQILELGLCPLKESCLLPKVSIYAVRIIYIKRLLSSPIL